MFQIEVRRYSWPSLFAEPLHAHDEGLFLYAEDAPYHLVTDRALWLSMPGVGIWVPPGIASGVRVLGSPAVIRPLHLWGALPSSLPKEPTAISITPLLSCLVTELERLLSLFDRDAARIGAVEKLILHELAETTKAEARLPLPTQPGLRRVAIAQENAIDRPLPIDQAAAIAGMSERSFMRHFYHETKLTWRRWVNELRLLNARHQIAAGEPVGVAAGACGWQSPSAFAASYRRRFGHAPGADCPTRLPDA